MNRQLVATKNSTSHSALQRHEYQQQAHSDANDLQRAAAILILLSFREKS
jgi:hypothetical protein